MYQNSSIDICTSILQPMAWCNCNVQATLHCSSHNLQRAKGQAATAKWNVIECTLNAPLNIHMESGNHLPNFHFGGSMSVFVGGGQSICSTSFASPGMTDRCVLILILSGSDAKGKTLSPAMAWSTLYVTHALLRAKKTPMKLMLETSRNYINKMIGNRAHISVLALFDPIHKGSCWKINRWL